MKTPDSWHFLTIFYVMTGIALSREGFPPKHISGLADWLALMGFILLMTWLLWPKRPTGHK